MASVDWLQIVHDLGLGHPLKFLWEERAQGLTTYSNFYKQFYRKFPHLRAAASTARQFEPGERVEVDYAGGTIPWIDLKTGKTHEASVFVAGTGFSQLLFAWAADDMKSRNWLGAHRRLYEFLGGVPQVTVPDCLKQGVLRCHLYDPDLNPAYAELAAHYRTSVVPARPGHPKDKAIAEGLVRILMRYFRYRFRGRRFTSLSEINAALLECVIRLNTKPHSRFGVSRQERFEKLEKPALKPLPQLSFEVGEWKTAKLHPDCYVPVEGAYYSAPHVHRGKTLRVKLSENHVEIFLDLERLAIHPRDYRKIGARVKVDSHFPENSRAYYEATPQRLLSQSRFISPALNALLVDLFKEDVFGNIRRAQGLIRTAAKEIHATSRENALPRIDAAISMMRRYQKTKCSYFQDLLVQSRRRAALGYLEHPTNDSEPAREIARRPGNPMLRYGSSRVSGGGAQQTLNLEKENP